jgi:hypothetical protein
VLVGYLESMLVLSAPCLFSKLNSSTLNLSNRDIWMLVALIPAHTPGCSINSWHMVRTVHGSWYFVTPQQI